MGALSDVGKTEIACDGCGQVFRPRPYEAKAGQGSVQMQFNCPHCERLYPVAHITKEGLRVRRRLKQAERRGDRDEVVRLREELRPHVTRASR